jgi:hypothetical protein
MDKNTFGPFTVEVEMDILAIRRGEARVQFLPGEAGTATQLIGMARQMEKFKVLPPKLASSPWEVRFNEEGTLEWVHEESRDAGIMFKFDEADALVEGIQSALHKYTDVSTIRGGAGPGASGYSVPEPPFDGR